MKYIPKISEVIYLLHQLLDLYDKEDGADWWKYSKPRFIIEDLNREYESNECDNCGYYYKHLERGIRKKFEESWVLNENDYLIIKNSFDLVDDIDFHSTREIRKRMDDEYEKILSLYNIYESKLEKLTLEENRILMGADYA